jgi:hypothetical protein
MKWGIFDLANGVWLGDKRGPRLYDDEGACASAEVMAQLLLGSTNLRLVTREFPDGALFHMAENFTETMTPLEALEWYEVER